jgi:methylenetetrahydrofolate dehydrogenase (NADP+) / methenyltetrahydrofolate cyclohydrolase
MEEINYDESKIINGTEISKIIKEEIKEEVILLKNKNIIPGLAVVLVGTRKDSQTYVNMKKKASKDVGFFSIDTDLPEDVTEEELIDVVKKLNNNDKIHGILIQLPRLF